MCCAQLFLPRQAYGSPPSRLPPRCPHKTNLKNVANRAGGLEKLNETIDNALRTDTLWRDYISTVTARFWPGGCTTQQAKDERKSLNDHFNRCKKGFAEKTKAREKREKLEAERLARQAAAQDNTSVSADQNPAAAAPAAHASGTSAAAATSNTGGAALPAEPSLRSAADVLMGRAAAASTSGPQPARSMPGVPDAHLSNMEKLLKKHEASVSTARNHGHYRMPYFAEVLPSHARGAANLSDYIGTRAYFVDPCLAGETMECLCGGLSKGSNRKVVRHGYCYRTIADVDGSYILVGVKYKCKGQHDRAEMERKAAERLLFASEKAATYFTSSLHLGIDIGDLTMSFDNTGAGCPDDDMADFDEASNVPTAEDGSTPTTGSATLSSDSIVDESAQSPASVQQPAAASSEEAPRGATLGDFHFRSTTPWAMTLLSEEMLMSYDFILTRKCCERGLEWRVVTVLTCDTNDRCLCPPQGKCGISGKLAHDLRSWSLRVPIQTYYKRLRENYYHEYHLRLLKYLTASWSRNPVKVCERVDANSPGLEHLFPK